MKNIPGIKSAKKRVLITKIKNEKEEIITSRKGIANVLENMTTMNKKNLNKKSERMKMRAASMYKATTPMR